MLLESAGWNKWLVCHTATKSCQNAKKSMHFAIIGTSIEHTCAPAGQSLRCPLCLLEPSLIFEALLRFGGVVPLPLGSCDLQVDTASKHTLMSEQGLNLMGLL